MPRYTEAVNGHQKPLAKAPAFWLNPWDIKAPEIGALTGIAQMQSL